MKALVHLKPRRSASIVVTEADAQGVAVVLPRPLTLVGSAASSASEGRYSPRDTSREVVTPNERVSDLLGAPAPREAADIKGGQRPAQRILDGRCRGFA